MQGRLAAESQTWTLQQMGLPAAVLRGSSVSTEYAGRRCVASLPLLVLILGCISACEPLGVGVQSVHSIIIR